jgi:hypothetical protein
MGIEGLAGAGAKGLDFEGRKWVRLFQGEYAKAKLVMARLDDEKVCNRLDVLSTTAVAVEVQRRSLPEARTLMADALKMPYDVT